MEILMILIFAIIFITVAGIDKSKLKGKIGEVQVSTLIKKHLNNSDYHLIENVTIPGKAGTTQIDHVIVSAFGIFVIEVKNIKGWIFGGEKQKNWTQKFPQKSYSFQNPLHQNYRHLKTLSAVLGIHQNKFHSIVCFVGDSKFKTQLPKNVLKPDQFVRHIHTFTVEILDTKGMSKAIHKIQKARLQPSRATDKGHVESLKSKHQKIDRKIG